MPQKDENHEIVRQALLKDGWEITDEIFSEPMDLIVINMQAQQVKQWIKKTTHKP
jgi:hypothetical protein